MSRVHLKVAFASLALGGFALAASPEPQQTADPPAKTKSSAPKAKATRRDRPGYYMGRRIADVMSFEGAEWLVRDTREQEEEPDRMLDALKIPEGATVADIGAGVGYTSLRLSKRVGRDGTVYATDLQPEMLRMLAENARDAGVRNVKPVLATPTQTKLPDGKVDLAIMVDVYHECPNPEATLAGIRKALRPGGRLVLVEYRGEDPEVPIKPEHKMTLRQVRRELEPQGYAFKESLEFLPWQHVIIFEKPADPEKPAAKPEAASTTPR